MRKTKKAKKVMLINAQHPEECRAVILNNNIIDDYIVEHSALEQIRGNVYLGVINRIEPSIEAAFVDFGYKKFGFLPFKDVLKESYVHTGEKKAKTRIQDVLMRGQKILVQVTKESRDAKGPTLNNALSIPGRFLVLMHGQGNAVSRKIEDESERKKLKDIVSDFDLPENLGLIIRTAGVGRSKIELQKDLQMLLKVWNKIESSFADESISAPYLMYQEPDLVVRTFRDHYSSDTSQIIVDNSDAYKSLKDFARLVMPRSRNLVKLYKETRPLFSEYNVEEQIESIYERKVPLPSGGSIIIDIGEAMAAIDVNSGKTKSGLDLEETAVTTNLEAAKEIARQLRLRDLGGLVVIDFIDMYQKKNKAAVEKELKLACKTDKARINLSRISKFGLLEMSRQRISPPVKDGIFDECNHCKGSGYIRSINSMVLLIFRKIQELIAKGNVKVIGIEISSEITNFLLNKKMNSFIDLKHKYQVDIKFKSKPDLIFEDFKFEILESNDEDLKLEPKIIASKYDKELDSLELVKTKSEVSNEENENLKSEGEVVKTKRRYSKRKPSIRRGQSRTRDRRPYSKRKKSDIEKNSGSDKELNKFLENEDKTKSLSNEGEPPVIPLPPPFVR